MVDNSFKCLYKRASKATIVDTVFAQDAKEDKHYNYYYLHRQQHVYHIISDRSTSCTYKH